MTSSIVALQSVAVAVASVLDDNTLIAALTQHAGPQCQRLGSDLTDEIPTVLYQTANARRVGGLLGSFQVDVELYALAATTQDASDLLAAAVDALTPVALAAAGLDVIPEEFESSNSETLDEEEVPFPEAVGVATTLTFTVYLPS